MGNVFEIILANPKQSGENEFDINKFGELRIERKGGNRIKMHLCHASKVNHMTASLLKSELRMIFTRFCFEWRSQMSGLG